MQSPLSLLSPRVPSAGGQGPVVGSQPPEPPQNAWAGLELEVRKLVPEADQAEIIGALRDLAEGAPELRLDRPSPGALEVLCGFSPETWIELNQAAIAATGQPFTSAFAPVRSLEGFDARLNALVEGLSGLSSLTNVTFDLPSAEQFLSLQLTSLPLNVEHVRLQLHPSEERSELRLEVNVRAGVRVQGIPPDGHLMVHKSVVHQAGSDDKSPSQTCTLEGVAYFRAAPKLPQPQPQPQAPAAKRRRIGNDNKSPEELEANRKAVDVNLNMKATQGKNLIVCRHLASHWLRQRHQYHQDGKSAEHARYSMSELADVESISAEVNVEMANELLSDTKEQRDYLDESQYEHAFANTGKAFAEHFAGMKPGESKLLLLSTTDHSMGAELQVKKGPGGKHEYVVTVYDPNTTMTHVRSVFGSPEDLRAKPLAFWLGKTVADDYSRPLPGKYYAHDHGWGNLQVLQWPPASAEELARKAVARAMATPGVQALAGKDVEVTTSPDEAHQCRQNELRGAPVRTTISGKILLTAKGEVRAKGLEEVWPSQLDRYGVTPALFHSLKETGVNYFYFANSETVRLSEPAAESKAAHPDG